MLNQPAKSILDKSCPVRNQSFTTGILFQVGPSSHPPGVSVLSAFSAHGQQLSAQLAPTASATDISHLTPHDFDYACNASGVENAARDMLTFEQPFEFKINHSLLNIKLIHF